MPLYKVRFATEVGGVEITEASFEATDAAEALDKFNNREFKTSLVTQRSYSVNEVSPESVQWLNE